MPNWADDEGRYYWCRPDDPYWKSVEIPHAPVSSPWGCDCAKCQYDRLHKNDSTEPQVTEEFLDRLMQDLPCNCPKCDYHRGRK